MGVNVRSLLQFRDRRVRIGFTAILLVVIGIAGYFGAQGFWAERLHRRANDALERLDFQEASDYLDRYLAIRPTDGTMQVLAAQTARRRGDFEGAKRHLALARKHGAGRDAIDVEDQLLRIQAGDLMEAGPMASFSAKNPASPEAGIALEALIQGSLKALQLPMANHLIDLWLKHRRTTLDQARGLVWRGQVREIEDNLPLALEAYRKAVEKAPDYVPARLRLTEALLRDDPRQATAELDWLRRHHPGNIEVRFLSARLHRNLSQPEEAARLLDDILAAEPNRVPALLERARVALDVNKTDDAERWLLRAYELAPDQRDVNVAMAACLRQALRLDEAAEYQKRAQEIEDRLQKVLDEMQKKRTLEKKS